MICNIIGLIFVQKNIYEIDGKLKELGHFDQAERNVLKLLYRYEFHQHFTRDFFADILAPKICKAESN
jgi:hypothetical protein